MTQEAIDHYRKAAEHHERAARHNKGAANHHASSNHEKARQHAHLHSATTCMPPIIEMKQLNISPRKTVPTNYGGNVSEARRTDQDVKIDRDFRIGSSNNLL